MKTVLEAEDIQAIADRIVEVLRPLLPAVKQEDDIFNKKELSQYLKVNVSWINTNLYALPHFKAGKYVRFKRSLIDRWIEETSPSNSFRKR